MKFFQKRSTAALVMALAILAGVGLGRIRAPESGPAVSGSFSYLLHNEGNVISQKTARYFEAMNESLFAQTGAQIVVDVVDTTGGQDIAGYAEETFVRYGVGSKERDNGILLVLALRNMHNGAPDGDYYMAWGGGFSSSQRDRLENIMWDHMEEGFVVQRYELAARTTFDALVDYLEDIYHVTVRENYLPDTAQSYQALSGGYASTGGGGVLPEVLLGEIVVLLAILLIVWVAADGLRYRRYRRRYWGPTVVGVPRPVYYPIFWGRPRRPQVPPRPPRPGFTGGGSFGGGAGRSSRPGGFSGGGSFGGGAGRSSRPGGFSGGGAGRSGAGRAKSAPRPRSGGMNRGPRPGGGGRRR